MTENELKKAYIIKCLTNGAFNVSAASRATKVSSPTLSRLASGRQKSIRSDALDALYDYFYSIEFDMRSTSKYLG